MQYLGCKCKYSYKQNRSPARAIGLKDQYTLSPKNELIIGLQIGVGICAVLTASSTRLRPTLHAWLVWDVRLTAIYIILPLFSRTLFSAVRPLKIAIDVTSRLLYFTESSYLDIAAVTLDGHHSFTVVSGLHKEVVDLALYPARG